MPQVEAVPAQVAYAINEKLEGEIRQMYRIIYFSEIHPNEADLAQTQMVKLTVNLFAIDCTDALRAFSDNVPDEYPVRSMIACMPVNPDILESSLLEIKRGPRVVQ